MKIYEIRETTDEEVYYTKGFFSDREKAIEEIKRPEAYMLADCYEDNVKLEVIEHEIDKWNHEDQAEVKILTVYFSKEYDEEKDDYVWTMTIDFEKSVDVNERLIITSEVRPHYYCPHCGSAGKLMERVVTDSQGLQIDPNSPINICNECAARQFNRKEESK